MPTLKLTNETAPTFIGRRVRVNYGSGMGETNGMIVGWETTKWHTQVSVIDEDGETHSANVLYEDGESQVGVHLYPDDAGWESFGDFCEIVDDLLGDLGKTQTEVGLVRKDLQEYADAEEAGQTPQQMVADWIQNGQTLKLNYEDEPK